jgi:hypothetical protein
VLRESHNPRTTPNRFAAKPSASSLWRIAAAITSSTLLSACTLVTPARYDRVAPIDNAFATSSSTPLAPFTGKYIATIHTPWTGPIRGEFHAEPTDTGFRANTKPDVAWSLIGGLEGTLGPIFAPFLFPRGMILTWESTTPLEDLPGVGTIGFGTRSSMRITTRIREPGAPVELLLKDGRAIATISLARAKSMAPTPVNHALLINSLRDRITQNYYDPQRAASTEMARYLDDLTQGATKAQDDIEFLLVQGLAARQSPKVPAILMYPKPSTSTDDVPGVDDPILPYQVIKSASTSIVTIRFDAILSESTVDECFDKALAMNPRGIVLDLRQTAGLDVGTLRILSYITTEPINAGTFVANTDRDAILSGSPPTTTIYLRTPADYATLRSSIANGTSTSVSVFPSERSLTIPIAVAIGKRAGGPTELLAHAIRTNWLAPVFGEPTAGRPWLAQEIDLGQNWIARLPMAECFTADHQSLTDQGVEPWQPIRGPGSTQVARRWITDRLNRHTWDEGPWTDDVD